MKKNIKGFLNKPFVRNVFILVSGTIAAQIITMGLSPVITRMYGPEAFGILGTFNAIISITLPIAALSYPIAIVLPEKNREAKGLIKLSLLITSAISLISFIIIILLNEQIANLFNLNDIAGYLYLIPLVVIFGGLMQVAEQWLIRTKQFSINARVTFLQSLITNGSKVGIGFFYPVASVLVVLTALGNGIRAFLMILFAKKTNESKYKSDKSTIVDLKYLAKKYYDFPVYRAPEILLNAVSQSLPILMLTSFFGPASAGFYSIGRTVLSIPSQLIGKSVGDVFYPRIAEAKNKNENLNKLIWKGTIGLASIGIIPYGIIILFGPELFGFVFGSEWVVAGEYARWISLWSFFGFINRPSVHSLPVLNAQRFHLMYTIFMLTTRTGVLALSYFIFLSDVIAVALFGISGALLNLGLITFTLKISKTK